MAEKDFVSHSRWAENETVTSIFVAKKLDQNVFNSSIH